MQRAWEVGGGVGERPTVETVGGKERGVGEQSGVGLYCRRLGQAEVPPA